MGDQVTRLELPAEISSLRRFRDFVRCGAKAAAFGERELGQLELVVEEILVNVARYAYPEGKPGNIEVGYAVEGGNTLFVQVSDTGRPFDPLTNDPPDLRRSLAERPVGGLGIFLVRQFAHTVEYRRIENRNILSFRLVNTAKFSHD
jgi:anti-sigma regulatory factor (Ser/Thr protein kinase)